MPEPLVVLHVDAGDEWRGGQQQALYLMEGLARAGHDSILAAPHRSPLSDRAAGQGFRVRSLPVRGEWDVVAAWRLSRIVAEEKPHLLHFHDARSAAIGAMLRHPTRPPTVVSRRVDFPLGRNPFSRWKYRRCDRIVAVSRRIAEVCREGGIDGGKISVVHDGVDAARFARRMPKAEARRRLGLSADRELIGVIAALVDHKGHRYLIEALPIVCASRPAVCAVLAGDGPLRGELERLRGSRRLESEVQFLGQIDDVSTLLAAIDLFVLPSHMEGLCQALIEAMAAGVPVVSTTAGGIPEVVEDERSGLLVPPRDAAALARAILRVLGDGALAERLGRGALSRAEEFGTQLMVRGTLAVYRALLLDRQ